LGFKAWMAFAALSIIWGFPYFLIKLTVAELSPMMIAWARVTLAACILLPLAWRRGALRSLGGQAVALCAFALAEFAIPFAAISLGERWVGSSLTGILIATVPMGVILLSRSFGVQEQLGWRRSAGLAIGFAGVVTLLGCGSVTGLSGWAGIGCILISALGYAVGPLIIQRHLNQVDSLGALAASLLIASMMLAIPALLSSPKHLPSATALAALAALGIVCTALAMMLMFYLVSHAGASRASLITYINPAVASLLGFWLLHEQLGAGGLAAFALILLGSWLATRATPIRRTEMAAER